MQNLWSFTKETMPFVGPLVSGLVAAFLVHLLSRARDREARKGERESLIAERRREFQRETLLAVQDETMRFIKATLKMRELESVAAPKHAALPDGLLADFISARDRISILKVRIHDEEIRKQAELLDDLCLGSTHYFQLDEEAKKRLRNKAIEAHHELNRMIGKELAALDTFEQTK
jgi:hypothetical protein